MGFVINIMLQISSNTCAGHKTALEGNKSNERVCRSLRDLPFLFCFVFCLLLMTPPLCGYISLRSDHVQKQKQKFIFHSPGND